ncbi:MAG: TolB-like translocation protein [Aggregatilineales bacterium]
MFRKTVLIAMLPLTVSVAASHNYAYAQASPSDSYDVFLNRTATPGSDTLYFVSARTGLSTVVTVNSAANINDYALLGGGLVFRDKTGTANEAYPDGHIAPLNFIGTAPSGGSIRWAVSPDHSWIVWVIAHTEAGSLLSDLYVARADGTGKQLALHTSSSKGLGLRPLAITNDGSAAFYSRQADSANAVNTYLVAPDVYQVTTAAGQPVQLPGEPRCPCTAAFSADGRLFFRLESTAHGFAAHFVDLSANPAANSPGNTEVRLDPPGLIAGFSIVQAGDALLSDKGNLAVYSVASGALGTKAAQYALILADATQRQQRVIVPPRSERLRPVAFAPNALILVGADKDGTYRLWLPDGTLTPLSADTYLGTLNQFSR